MERKDKEHPWRARTSPQWFARGKERRFLKNLHENQGRASTLRSVFKGESFRSWKKTRRQSYFVFLLKKLRFCCGDLLTSFLLVQQ